MPANRYGLDTEYLRKTLAAPKREALELAKTFTWFAKWDLTLQRIPTEREDQVSARDEVKRQAATVAATLSEVEDPDNLGDDITETAQSLIAALDQLIGLVDVPLVDEAVAPKDVAWAWMDTVE